MPFPQKCVMAILRSQPEYTAQFVSNEFCSFVETHNCVKTSTASISALLLKRTTVSKSLQL